MKIAYIGLKGIPALSGGVERHVEELAVRLKEKGNVVTVYSRSTYSDAAEEQYKGVKIETIKTVNSKNFNAIVYTIRATIAALKDNFDILHYHAIGPASLIFIPLMFRRQVVVTVHGLDWKREKWGRLAKAYLKLGERVTGKKAPRIIAVSEDLKKYFTQKYHRSDEEAVFIPNGVTIRGNKTPEEIKKYGLNENGYLLFLARLVPEKGAHYLIEAYKGLNSDKKLVIAGGASYTDSYSEKLQALSKGDPNIIFTGHAAGNLLTELYCSCYLYVLPSDTEGMPITLLEAMSFGKCCLVSDIPENTYVLKDKKYGFTFHHGDVQDLKAKLIFLLDNPEMVRNMGSVSRPYVEKEYNWDKITEATLDVYKSLL